MPGAISTVAMAHGTRRVATVMVPTGIRLVIHTGLVVMVDTAAAMAAMVTTVIATATGIAVMMTKAML